MEETSGAELLTGGVTKVKDQLKKLEAGGVLFIDEAYQLNPKTNPMGAQVRAAWGSGGWPVPRAPKLYRACVGWRSEGGECPGIVTLR